MAVRLAGRDPEYDGKYNPEQFNIPAQDSKGHTTRAQCYIQPGHDREIEKILGSRKFPFRTKGDLVRWCIVKGMERLLAMEDEIPKGYMVQVDAMIDIIRESEFQQSFDSTIRMTTQRVSSLMGEGATGEAQRLVSNLLYKVREMEDGYWRDKWESKIRELWGYLLDGPGVALR